ncbi:MAG: (2Fe-2S)-binding protein [Tissierellia bacterium]|nr:(2Fe-2S)-binding protein [Tissierellia bacterium]
MKINYILNGESMTYDGDLSRSLMDVLREDEGLTGVKCVCREGECGACSVLLNGEIVNSCILPMGRVHGCEITTIEGFREQKAFEILDASFKKYSAVQCGFCIPGMILASTSLLSKNPHPTKEEIKIGISGNLCRCTGYHAIEKAICDAAEKGEGLW